MIKLDDMRRPPDAPTTAAMIVYLMAGLIIWGLQLTIVYGAHALICARGGAPWLAVTVVGVATAAAGLLIVLMLLNQRGTGRLFGLRDEMNESGVYDSISRILGVLSLIGIVWSGLAVMIVPACGLVR